MSVIKVNNITSRDGTTGPVIAGITTVSSTSHLVVPTGSTGQRVALAPDPFINNLVLALPFNSESVFTDVSPKGNGDPAIVGFGTTSFSLPAGIVGVATTSSGITTFSKYYGNSLYIDGSNDYLAFQNSSNFNVINESYTIEMWIHPLTMIGNNGSLFTLYNEGGSRGSYYTRIDSSGFVRFLENATGSGPALTLDTPTGIVTSGVWHHVAFVKDAPSQTKAILVNGVVRASIGSTGTVPSVYSNTQDPLMIGAFNLLSSPGGYFNGYMQDIRMYKGIAKYNIVGVATGTTVFTPPSQIAL